MIGKPLEIVNLLNSDNQTYEVAGYYLPEVESRTQGSRPRTQKKSKAKDSLSEDRHSRGQGQECSRPKTKDTSASALQKKKKGLHKNFSGDLQKKIFKRSPQQNVFEKIFQQILCLFEGNCPRIPFLSKHFQNLYV